MMIMMEFGERFPGQGEWNVSAPISDFHARRCHAGGASLARVRDAERGATQATRSRAVALRLRPRGLVALAKVLPLE
eukprot:COSAG03_NODE_385_length_8317_cov_7.240813_3_plen_77_part_00